jgi:hypothetical protein
MVAVDRDEGVAGEAAIAVELLNGRVAQGDEVFLGGVEEIGQAAAVAVGREGRDPDDPVAWRVDRDALVAVLHTTLIGRSGAELKDGRTLWARDADWAT